MGFCIIDIYILSLVNHMPNWKKIILIHLQHPASAKKIHHIVTIIQSIIYNSEHSVASSIPDERNLPLSYHGGEPTHNIPLMFPLRSLRQIFGDNRSYLTQFSTLSILAWSNVRASRPTHTRSIEVSPERTDCMNEALDPSSRRRGSALINEELDKRNIQGPLEGRT